MFQFLVKAAALLLVVLAAHPAFGQRPTGISQFPTGSQGGRSGGGNQRESAPDTTAIFIFHADAPWKERIFRDSLLPGFQQYDPVRQQSDDLAHLGLPGSAVQSLVFDATRSPGFHLGLTQYQLYYKDGNSLPYYRLARPYSNFWFQQGTGQNDNIVKMQFARNFANGIHYTVDYQAFSQLSARGQYPNQSNQTRSLATGFWFHERRGRYDGFLSFAANTTNSLDNGGLRELPETGGEFESPATAEVYLDDARTRHALREWMYTHYLRFGGRIDSTGRLSRAFTIRHTIDYDRNTYRFSNTFNDADTFFFNFFPELLTDARGVRGYMELRSLENTFALSSEKLRLTNPATTAKAADNALEVGLKHQYKRLQQEPDWFTYNNLLLYGKLHWQQKENINLDAEAHFVALGQVGDYLLKGNLAIAYPKVGQLQLRVTNQLYAPSILDDLFYLTQTPLWQENFDKTLALRLGATYTLDRFKLSLGIDNHLVNNLIYYDTMAMPRQLADVANVLQLFAEKTFSLGHLHLHNRLMWQTTGSVGLELPRWHGKHSLYYAGKWFKVLDVNIGTDLRYTTHFFPNYYNPMTGRFHLQQRQDVGFNYNVDFFFSMKIARFRAFAKMENLAVLWAADERFYTTAFNPWPGNAFRIGINWRMID